MKLSSIYKSLTLIVMLLVCSMSYAGGGDDKKTPKDTTKISHKDSVLILHNSTTIDDTLVFEDWDSPDGDGTNSEVGMVYHNGGGVSSGTGSNTLNQLIENGIQNLRAKKYTVEFIVFPNPAVSSIMLQANNPAQEIRIIDILGNDIKRIPYQTTIDIYDIPRGTYFIQLIYFDHTESRKFIKAS